MRSFNPQAGGIFLAVGILGGFAWGVAAGNPLLYSLLGGATGVVLALLLWLLDRRRR